MMSIPRSAVAMAAGFLLLLLTPVMTAQSESDSTPFRFLLEQDAVPEVMSLDVVLASGTGRDQHYIVLQYVHRGLEVFAVNDGASLEIGSGSDKVLLSVRKEDKRIDTGLETTGSPALETRAYAAYPITAEQLRLFANLGEPTVRLSGAYMVAGGMGGLVETKHKIKRKQMRRFKAWLNRNLGEAPR